MSAIFHFRGDQTVFDDRTLIGFQNNLNGRMARFKRHEQFRQNVDGDIMASAYDERHAVALLSARP